MPKFDAGKFGAALATNVGNMGQQYFMNKMLQQEEDKRAYTKAQADALHNLYQQTGDPTYLQRLREMNNPYAKALSEIPIPSGGIPAVQTQQEIARKKAMIEAGVEAGPTTPRYFPKSQEEAVEYARKKYEATRGSQLGKAGTKNRFFQQDGKIIKVDKETGKSQQIWPPPGNDQEFTKLTVKEVTSLANVLDKASKNPDLKAVLEPLLGEVGFSYETGTITEEKPWLFGTHTKETKVPVITRKGPEELQAQWDDLVRQFPDEVVFIRKAQAQKNKPEDVFDLLTSKANAQ